MVVDHPGRSLPGNTRLNRGKLSTSPAGMSPRVLGRRPVSAGRSAPGKGRVAHGVQLAGGVPAELEWLQQVLPFPHHLFRDQGSNSNHLVAMVGVGDDVCVPSEPVEDRKVVRSEGSDSAGGRLALQSALALESLLAVGPCWCPE